MVWKVSMATDEKQKMQKSEDEWRRELTPEQYHILREKGTERGFHRRVRAYKEDGVYRCAACGQELFELGHQV